MSRHKNGFPKAGDATPELTHPDAEDLLRHVAGELPAADVERVRQHVEDCGECRGLVRDYRAFPNLEPPTDAHRMDAEEMRRTLGMLRVRSLAHDRVSLAKAVESSAELVRLRSPGQARGASAAPAGLWARWWGRAAAVLLLLVSGWGIQRHATVGRLEERSQDLEERLAASEAAFRQPRANAVVISLLATEDPLRSAEAFAYPLGEAGFTAVIPPDEPFPPGRYTAEVRRSEGETVLRVSGIEPRASGIFFYLPPGALPVGEYEVWLVRDDGEEWPTSFELPIGE